MHSKYESTDDIKRLKLDEISEQFEIGVNSLRYHLKKLKPLFLDVSRDRYNRFLFTPSQIDRLLQVHKLKGQGYPYEKISEHFNTQPEHNLNNPPSTIDYNSINTSATMGRELELKIQQIENHHRKLHEINKILIKNNKHFDNIIKEQNAKIESLEERVALLVDLHTENLLKRGLSFTEKFNNITEEEDD